MPSKSEMSPSRRPPLGLPSSLAKKIPTPPTLNPKQISISSKLSNSNNNNTNNTGSNNVSNGGSNNSQSSKKKVRPRAATTTTTSTASKKENSDTCASSDDSSIRLVEYFVVVSAVPRRTTATDHTTPPQSNPKRLSRDDRVSSPPPPSSTDESPSSPHRPNSPQPSSTRQLASPRSRRRLRANNNNTAPSSDPLPAPPPAPSTSSSLPKPKIPSSPLRNIPSVRVRRQTSSRTKSAPPIPTSSDSHPGKTFRLLLTSPKTTFNRVLHTTTSSTPLPNTYAPSSPLTRTRRNNDCHSSNISLSSLDPPSQSTEGQFTPVITARYPLQDRPNNPLNSMVTRFCHPGTDTLHLSREYMMPSVHHFVLTNSRGNKLYGTCLTIYEPYKTNDSELELVDDDASNSIHGNDSYDSAIEISIRKREAYLPKCLCLLTSAPYLTAFREYLTALYRLVTSTTNVMTAPLERYIVNLCEEIPAPPPGAFEIRTTILDRVVRFWSPPAMQPVAYVGLSFRTLFECLDVGNVIFVWNALALERKVLLVSSQKSLLTVCAEILLSLLFPMTWPHLYIPVVPRFLAPMLDAPMPYLCGVARSIFREDASEHLANDAILVDLDKNEVTMGPTTLDLPALSKSRRAKLESTLKANAGHVFWQARCLDKTDVLNIIRDSEGNVPDKEKRLRADAAWGETLRRFDDAIGLAYAPNSVQVQEDEVESSFSAKQSAWDAVQEAFLRFYSSMLKDYRKFLNTDAATSGHHKDGFAGEAFLENQPLSYQPFLKELVQTQQFDEFITRRLYDPGRPDVEFFDQSIDAKSNRSKLKLRKTDTPLLQSAYAHKQLAKWDAVPVNTDGIAPGPYNYEEWPDTFNPDLLGTPRPLPKMIVAEFDRQSALAAKLRRGSLEEKDVEAVLGMTDTCCPQVATFSLFFVLYTSTIGSQLDDFAEETMMDRGLKKTHSKRETNRDNSDHRRTTSRRKRRTGRPPPANKTTPYDETEISNIRNDDFTLRNENSTHSVDTTPITRHTRHDNSSHSADTTPITRHTRYNNSSNLKPTLLDDRLAPPSPLLIPELTPRGSSYTYHHPRPPQSAVSSDGETSTTSSLLTPSTSSVNLTELEDVRAHTLRQLDLAFDILETMNGRKLVPDTLTYKCLVEACGRCGDVERAQELMDDIVANGVASDGILQNCFMKAFNVNNMADLNLNRSGGGDGDGSSTAWGMGGASSSSRDPESLPSLLKQMIKANSSLSHAAAEQLKSISNLSSASSLREGIGGKSKSTGLSTSNHSGGKVMSTISETSRHKDINNNDSPLASSFLSDVYNLTTTLVSDGAKKLTQQQQQPSSSQPTKKQFLTPDFLIPHIAISEYLLHHTYPHLTINTNIESCPQCSTLLTEDDIFAGFHQSHNKNNAKTKNQSQKQFTISCPQCHRDVPVPHFSVSSSSERFEGSQGRGTTLYCEFLSPWVVGREVRLLVREESGGGNKGGVTKVVERMGGERWRWGVGIEATLWWNIVVSFRRYGIPLTFLLGGEGVV